MLDVTGMTLDNPRGNVSGVKFGGPNPDQALLVKFFKQPRRMDSKSDAAGREVHESVICIQIDAPGDRTTTVVRRARVGEMKQHKQIMEPGTPGALVNVRDDDDDARRFPHQWAAFNAQADQNLNGTPLSELRFLSIEVIAEYNASKVFTAEQLAGIPDSSLNKLPLDARVHRTKAQAFIDAALGNAPLLALAGENEKLKADLALKGEQMAEILDRMAKLEAEDRPRRGRPPNALKTDAPEAA